MFTGIVEEVGRVAALERHEGHARLQIACREVLGGVAIGDSIAVAGCCVTVTELTTHGEQPGFSADLMAETLAATSLGDLTVGDEVNLERAMRADARLGGHLVQGHVDGVGQVVARREEPGTVWLSVSAPAHLAPYLVAKGSVTIDGASLTVVDVTDHAAPPTGGTAAGAATAPASPGQATPVADAATFRVALIPHTLAVTTFGARHVGDRVNLETDVIAKYVERLLVAGTPTPYSPPQEA
jgi:riboflavin synthase